MRAFILETIYEWSKTPYQRWFKKNPPWEMTTKTLIQFPKDSLGFHLGCFLLKHNFSPQPKLENHDVFHVLTDTGTSVPEEISMQYYLLGNGKRSIYLFMVILLGTILYPDKLLLFKRAYQKGKVAYPFHQLDYQKLLHKSIETIRTTFLISSICK
ncbi:hypothetical protein [Aquimarina sp. 2201CG5-10]|uniref:hypothetical protein n=1 Tax=Aquimarina callyspongiae TaxID=3098150 RepID=UPI002AB4C96D|nr:hypothetical protein [Aquimarina sp. 2201CG5-10]MDY8138571.1 hypothetical protein [Aquimarina sp. 2201CG5-10]